MNPELNEDLPVMEPEQAQDLAALMSQADAGPLEPGQVQEPEPAQRLPLEQEIAGALQMASTVIAPMLPSVAAIYTEETCTAIGAALAPLCKKYGWLQNGIGGEYGEEIMALCIVGPIGYATVIAAKSDIAQRKKSAVDVESRQVEQAAATTPGSKTVIIGAPVPA